MHIYTYYIYYYNIYTYNLPTVITYQLWWYSSFYLITPKCKHSSQADMSERSHESASFKWKVKFYFIHTHTHSMFSRFRHLLGDLEHIRCYRWNPGLPNHKFKANVPDTHFCPPLLTAHASKQHFSHTENLNSEVNNPGTEKNQKRKWSWPGGLVKCFIIPAGRKQRQRTVSSKPTLVTKRGPSLWWGRDLNPCHAEKGWGLSTAPPGRHLRWLCPTFPGS